MAARNHTITDLPSDSSKSTANSAIDFSAQSSNISNGQNTAVGEANGDKEQKSEAEQSADRLYEERMEDEYAKREGGA